MYRTHKLDELRISDVDKKVVVSGWVDKIRDMGPFIFIDLRDRYGITQILINENSPKEAFEIAKKTKSEYVLKIEGKVSERSSKNKNIVTGDIEVLAENIEILSQSKKLPFGINEENINENLRLSYRYLDLRRRKMLENIKNRDKMLFSIREFMNKEGFLDIDTPILGKATPEGARDFIVPSRIQKGDFYALPQSPQLFKQTLMVAGVDKYYQFAKCFRDEDLRSDRQPEFTQLDLEMSFIHQEDIMELVERLAKKVLKDITNQEQNEKFEVITYDYAMNNYGSDKPDLRFDMKIIDISNVVEKKGFSVFDSAIENKGSVRALVCDDKEFSRKKIKDLEEYVKTYFGIKGLAYIKIDKEGNLSSSISKFLTENILEELKNNFNLKNNSISLIIADEKDKTLQALGALRVKIAEELNLIDETKFNYLWVIDFPMFEWSEEENRYKAQHHPFTLIKAEDISKLKENKLSEIKTESYDLVLNGYEIGGGSLRIHDSELQSLVFEKLGLSIIEQQEKFGFFLETLKYGVPPHGGLAFGFDRWLMALLNEKTIKDVIPFPKTNKGQDLMTEAPSFVDSSQLAELNIEIKE